MRLIYSVDCRIKNLFSTSLLNIWTLVRSLIALNESFAVS